ncbi:MAG: MarR family transcriptional regulator [Desulfobacteraceae bacterium]|nr:MarR family transcriptional regulator [Desulfobacteraceae bacterium]
MTGFAVADRKGGIMTAANDEQCRNLLNSLRKIIQAIDQHSIVLKKKFGLTGPQLVTLQAVSFYAPISVTRISKVVSLSQASVTDITQRLEKKGYLSRARSCDDKRKTEIVLTQKGTQILDAVPPLLQERFTKRFSELERWEQLMIESAFERVVFMMSAPDFNAAPIMITGDEE